METKTDWFVVGVQGRILFLRPVPRSISREEALDLVAFIATNAGFTPEELLAAMNAVSE